MSAEKPSGADLSIIIIWQIAPPGERRRVLVSRETWERGRKFLFISGVIRARFCNSYSSALYLCLFRAAFRFRFIFLPYLSVHFLRFMLLLSFPFLSCVRWRTLSCSLWCSKHIHEHPKTMKCTAQSFQPLFRQCNIQLTELILSGHLGNQLLITASCQLSQNQTRQPFGSIFRYFSHSLLSCALVFCWFISQRNSGRARKAVSYKGTVNEQETRA